MSRYSHHIYSKLRSIPPTCWIFVDLFIGNYPTLGDCMIHLPVLYDLVDGELHEDFLESGV